MMSHIDTNEDLWIHKGINYGQFPFQLEKELKENVKKVNSNYRIK